MSTWNSLFLYLYLLIIIFFSIWTTGNLLLPQPISLIESTTLGHLQKKPLTPKEPLKPTSYSPNLTCKCYKFLLMESPLLLSPSSSSILFPGFVLIETYWTLNPLCSKCAKYGLEMDNTVMYCKKYRLLGSPPMPLNWTLHFDKIP